MWFNLNRSNQSNRVQFVLEFKCITDHKLRTIKIIRQLLSRYSCCSLIRNHFNFLWLGFELLKNKHSGTPWSKVWRVIFNLFSENQLSSRSGWPNFIVQFNFIVWFPTNWPLLVEIVFHGMHGLSCTLRLTTKTANSDVSRNLYESISLFLKTVSLKELISRILRNKALFLIIFFSKNHLFARFSTVENFLLLKSLKNK